MKRRSFLSLLGAAVATPALPAASTAAYSRQSFGLAVLHARTRAHVSVRGLAWCLKVPSTQAEAMLAEMTARGMVSPIGPGGALRAVSHILQPQPWHLAAGKAAARPTKATISAPTQGQPNTLPDWLRHVRKLAQKAGHHMQPQAVCA